MVKKDPTINQFRCEIDWPVYYLGLEKFMCVVEKFRSGGDPKISELELLAMASAAMTTHGAVTFSRIRDSSIDSIE